MAPTLPLQATSGTFRTAEPFLYQLLEDIHSGKVQVPDFQRPWVWDDIHVRDIIASVSLGQPIGAVMLQETGGDGSRFLPRPIEGVKLNRQVSPEKLILDGQQRLTSLYRALRAKDPVDTFSTKDEAILRLYYIDIRKCLDPTCDRYDAILSLPETRKMTSNFGKIVDLDLSDREGELGHELLPAHLIFDPAGWTRWTQDYYSFHKYAPEAMRRIADFTQLVWLPLQQYKLPVIELLKETPKESVCLVFEKVNTGGVALTVFELLTATFAADNFRLRPDWEARRGRLHDAIEVSKVLNTVSETDFLTALTLLVSYRKHVSEGSGVSCKRRDVLRLTLSEYESAADDVEKGLIGAARFLTRQKVFDHRSLPYSTQLIPLSVICVNLAPNHEDASVLAKLAQWFWSGVFGELYGAANETRYAQDVVDVINWIKGGPLPRTVDEANFRPGRLLSLQTRQSAAYKGVVCLLMKCGARDWIIGDPIELANYFHDAVDVHHIFPRAWATKRGHPERLWNSVVNKTPLAASTNKILSGDAPSLYLKRIRDRELVNEPMVSAHLKSSHVDPALLKEDDFKTFILRRAGAILDLIGNAMGKPVTGRDSEETIAAFGGAL